MDEYKESYLCLFRSTLAAIEQIDLTNYGEARQLLIKGQQDAEELFLSAPEMKNSQNEKRAV